MENKKRQLGQWDTIISPFAYSPVKAWLAEVDRLGLAVVEPFCGAGNLVRMLPDVRWAGYYDIDPRAVYLPVEERDCLRDFPSHSNATGQRFEAAITNPPWLSRASAGSRQIPFPCETTFDDLYKYALATCLANCPWVGAIVPESFLTTGLFLDRLQAVVRLPSHVFGKTTEVPACLALFAPTGDGNPCIWQENILLGSLLSLSAHNVFSIESDEIIPLEFNNPIGEIAVYALDSRKGRTIKFVVGESVSAEKVKRSSRHVIRIKLPRQLAECDIAELLLTANRILAEYRKVTCDIWLTASKCRCHDETARRRLDFDTIRRILTLAIRAVDNY